MVKRMPRNDDSNAISSLMLERGLVCPTKPVFLSSMIIYPKPRFRRSNAGVTHTYGRYMLHGGYTVDKVEFS